MLPSAYARLLQPPTSSPSSSSIPLLHASRSAVAHRLFFVPHLFTPQSGDSFCSCACLWLLACLSPFFLLLVEVACLPHPLHLQRYVVFSFSYPRPNNDTDSNTTDTRTSGSTQPYQPPSIDYCCSHITLATVPEAATAFTIATGCLHSCHWLACCSCLCLMTDLSLVCY